MTAIRMTDDLGAPGPVDWIVAEFPGSRFNGEVGPALCELVDRDLVRVRDLLILRKDPNGSLVAYELSDLEAGEIGELRSDEAVLALLLSAAVAATVEPGSTAAVVVWENTWAAPFASAVRRCGGQLIASGRLPAPALMTAIETDEQ